MVLIDADDDCPAELGPRLLGRAKQATHIPVSVVLANREFESWFLGAKESLRGVNGVVGNAIAPLDPENIRGAKEHLTRNMTRKSRYLAADDQVTFTEAFDLNLARQRCPSFERCFRESRALASRYDRNFKITQIGRGLLESRLKLPSLFSH
jgi:hypothetical protein